MKTSGTFPFVPLEDKKMNRQTRFLLILLLVILTDRFAGAGTGCTANGCHEGILSIVPENLGMMQMIQRTGQRHGDPDGCVVCHGGNPGAKKAKKAHKGVPGTLARTLGPKAFYPSPGSIWIARNTCGACHIGYVRRVTLSLMNTEAGKIQGNLHTWGIKEVKKFQVPWGNYAVEDRDGWNPVGASTAYQDYMETLRGLFDGPFVSSLKQLPNPDVAQIEKEPSLAAFTYQRQECNRCHIGIKGRQVRGDYRGMGCAACHMPYSNDGFYQGKDITIKKDEPGHILLHRINGNTKTTGIPVETCSSCHNGGKRIGMSFQGLMETPYDGPYLDDGSAQKKLHTRYYRYLSDDLHHQTDKSREGNPKAGLVCQDCHTSMDVHGDGNIYGTTLAQVEIECTDCHGTPDAYPWELPLGFGDEFGRNLAEKPRGITRTRLMTQQQYGDQHPVEEGLLLTARGNPFGNVVRKGDQVILFSAGGSRFSIPQLKTLHRENRWKDPSAETAMVLVKKHTAKLECYACHSGWAPQCYGCHVKVDYSAGKKRIETNTVDWIASGNKQNKRGLTAESDPDEKPVKGVAQITERTGYQRWENPILGINGEGRVSPLMPGCQVVYSVKGRDGRMKAVNRIAENPDETSRKGQQHVPLAIDMAPVQPHTSQRRARACESCHLNRKTAGLGINSPGFSLDHSLSRIVDLQHPADGRLTPERHTVQINGIEKLNFDWSKIVTRDGTQLATVGTHWPLSRAFNKRELDTILRTGICLGCHSKMDTDVFKRIAKEGTLDEQAHKRLMQQMLEKQ